MHKTKKVAVTVVAALVLALAAPAFTQPFADVPTDHWAFDAIAELAAKGLIEGYPDGTFRGDRALTRFEMAMIVARIIARIEAIPPPPPPPPLPPAIVALPGRVDAAEKRITVAEKRITVTEKSIALLTRLVAEFRAELAALGVRVTAVEEELARIRAKLDATRITGDLSHLFWGFETPAQAPRLGLNRIRLTYVGTIAPGLTANLRVDYRTFGNPNVAPIGVPPPPAAPIPIEVIFFDRAFLDWTTAFGVPGLRTFLGRQVIPALGPIGLLMDAPFWNDRRDGLRVDYTVAGVSMRGFVQWATFGGRLLTPAYVAGGRLSFAPIPGWTLGLNVRADTNPWVPAYGGFGFGADLVGDLIRGLRLRVEYAAYTPVAPPTRNFLFADLRFDLEALAGIAVLRPVLTVWYRNMDPLAFPAGAPRADPIAPDFLGVFGGGNLETWGGRLDLRGLFPGVDAWALVDTGRQISPHLPFTTWEVGASWALAPRTTLFLFYADNTAWPGFAFTGAPARTRYWGTFLSTSW